MFKTGMYIGLAVALTAGGLTGRAGPPSGTPQRPLADLAVKPKGDREHLQGTWVGQTVERGGVEGANKKAQAFRVVFDGDQVTFASDGETKKATVRLTPDAPVKVVVFTDESGAKRFGIYELDGDTLRLCVSRPGLTPPAKFEAGHELNVVLSRKKDHRPAAK